MGSVSSRGASSSMPGFLSMDPSHTVSIDAEQITKNDDAVGLNRTHVINQALSASCNDTDSKPIESRAHTRPSPGTISFSGLKDPVYPSDNGAICPHLPTPPLGGEVQQQTQALNPSPSSSRSSTPLTSPGSCPITPLTLPPDMSALQLHSPSSQIVGTPFATNSTRFEYPFPATPHNSTASMSHFPSPASSSLSVAPPSPGLAPCTNTPLSLAMPLTLPTQLSFVHPRMQKKTHAPIPPSLLKKRRDQNQMSTVDVSNTVNGQHDHSVHHTVSDSNLRRNGDGIKV